MKESPKILFTSPWGLYPKKKLEDDPIDYFYYRNTFKQNVFQLRSYQSWHSLHFLAQNVEIPSVVLENPSVKSFKKEIKNTHYQIVAIGFTIPFTVKVLEMVEWLKSNHKNIEIVLGGYGTAIFKEDYNISIKLKNLVDYICFGEGVEFMNQIIDKKCGIKKLSELKQNLIPAVNGVFRTKIKLFEQIVVVGGLGCVYGCSFCATAAQFNQKYIPLFTGRKLVEVLENQHKIHPKIQSVVIYEEDFLVNKKVVLEFIEHFSRSELSKIPFLLTVFASEKSIKKYSIEELIKCGIGTIFIGVESLSENVLNAETLKKRTGNIENLFKELHNNGINTLGSLVIGWDSQDFETLQADSERFIKMNPTFYQVVPLQIAPGLKLWDEMKEQNRIIENYDFKNNSIVDFNFRIKNYSRENALKIFFSTYKKLAQNGGPWPFRIFENTINGYLNLQNSENEIHLNRAKIYKSMLMPMGILAFSSRAFFHNKNFRKKWRITMKQFYKNFIIKFLQSAILSPFVIILLSTTYIFSNLTFFLKPNGDQPQKTRVEYEKEV
ncbi:MAG: hypothetical protein JXL97_09390 [Bacteroidales bacterium]|nr:hypothetical protein [Bacteroidales bacterium]